MYNGILQHIEYEILEGIETEKEQIEAEWILHKGHTMTCATFMRTLAELDEVKWMER